MPRTSGAPLTTFEPYPGIVDGDERIDGRMVVTMPAMVGPPNYSPNRSQQPPADHHPSQVPHLTSHSSYSSQQVPQLYPTPRPDVASPLEIRHADAPQLSLPSSARSSITALPPVPADQRLPSAPTPPSSQSQAPALKSMFARSRRSPPRSPPRSPHPDTFQVRQPGGQPTRTYATVTPRPSQPPLTGLDALVAAATSESRAREDVQERRAMGEMRLR